MADNTEHPAVLVQVVSAFLDRLGIYALPWILWTLICFAAVWKGNEQTLRYLGPWLYFTWIGLLAIVVTIIVITSIIARKDSLKAVVDPSNSERPSAK
jgi:hypothetical protein